MGYTHYWTQLRDFTPFEWHDMHGHVLAIMSHVERLGVPLVNGSGDAGSKPEFTFDYIIFNGAGADAHETFEITRSKAAWTFCKTNGKAYDLAVTAVLAYLASVFEGAYDVTSDGDADDWAHGVHLAREALPQFDNIIAAPVKVRG